MKIIYMAPLTSLGGHSLVSKILFENLKNKYKVIPLDLSLSSNHYGNLSLKRVLIVLYLLLKLFLNKKKSNCFYLTISQSLFGNLKDLLIFIFLFNKLHLITIHLHGGSIGSDLFFRFNFLKKINFFFSKRLKKIIISGNSHYSIFPKYLHRKITVIQNFAPDYMFNDYRSIEEKFNKPKKFRILFLSNMLPEKGYLKLFDGFKLLSKEISKNVILEFAGKFYNKELHANFLALIKKEKNIIYHGEVSNKKKKDLLHSSHIFCLPTSFLEGQPISIIEAYASGCFVLTSNKPGINDIFTNGINGFSLNKVNSLSIKTNFEKILSDKELCKKIAFKNRKLAGKSFKQYKYMESMEKIII